MPRGRKRKAHASIIRVDDEGHCIVNRPIADNATQQAASTSITRFISGDGRSGARSVRTRFEVDGNSLVPQLGGRMLTESESWAAAFHELDGGNIFLPDDVETPVNANSDGDCPNIGGPRDSDDAKAAAGEEVVVDFTINDLGWSSDGDDGDGDNNPSANMPSDRTPSQVSNIFYPSILSIRF